MSRGIVGVVALGLLALVGGCAHRPPAEMIRAYPLMDAAESLRVVAEGARRVRTLSGEGLITLTRPNGESVRLDAALVMRPPERARIRAWKFGRAVFDLTVTPEGVWVVSPEDSNRKEQIRSAGVSAGKLARTWAVLSGGFFEEPGLKAEFTDGRMLVRREASGGEPAVVCEVDRRTLTPRKYAMLDERGVTRFSLTMDRYEPFGDVVWPTRLFAVSEGGTVEVELRQVDVNPELADAAFTPPRRAERLP
jgi:outer membrane lipoprotein-sorting protein